MSGMKRNVVLALAVAAAVAAPGAFATNGYFAHGYGTKSKGLGGAGVALSQDAMAAATNPAGMAMVGNRWDLGAALFSPSPRSYEASAIGGGLGANGGMTGTGPVESENDIFLIPHFGINWMLDPNSSFGVSVYGNGGMNTEYPADKTPFGLGVFGSMASPTGSAGVDLMQLFVAATYAQKFSPKASWGISGIFAYQRFKADGLANFSMISTDDTNLSDKGYDNSNGFGAKVGVQGEVSPGLTLGASYQTKMRMSEFDKYKGLFAENGDFDIPSTWTVGLAYAVTPTSTVTLDVQKINYEDVKAVSNPISNLNGCMGGNLSNCLGGSDGIGFGWENITVYKLGYQWNSGTDMTWRVGYNQGDQPIPDSEVLFNILAPGVIEKHVTFGLTKQMGKNNELNFAAMHALNNEVSGVNTFGAPAQTVRLEMKQYEFEMSWATKF